MLTLAPFYLIPLLARSLVTLSLIATLFGAGLFGLGLAATSLSAPAAAKGITFIRDAEIEDTIRDFSAPVFRAAGLAPESVQILLVKDRSLNAFVALGQKLFIHTGLLMRADNASQVIGVIAHEAGHIAGGHLSRLTSQLKNTRNASLLGLLLGGAVAIGTGSGDAGAAIIAGSQTVAVRSFLGYTRAEESSADQAALRFLDGTGQSARGLLEFMRILGDQELLAASRQDPYVRTHPLTRDRINTVENHLQSSPHANDMPSAEFELRHQRMKAKLQGYINAPSRTLRTYKESDTSLPARYARAFAYYRKPDFAKGMAEIDGLLRDYPDDPYFHELRAQMLIEQRQVDDAVDAFQRSVDLAPRNALLLSELARTQIVTEKPEMIDAAIGHLQLALTIEPEMSSAWRQLGIAFGKRGDIGRSALALGEEALLTGRSEAALFQANKASKLFPHGSREWLRSEDIRRAAEKQRDEQRQ